MLLHDEPLNEVRRNVTFDLSEWAMKAPHSLALILGRRRVSYLELDAFVWAAAHYLFSKGARKGDIVVLAVSDQFALVLAYLATIRMGATAIVLAPNLTNAQREKVIADADGRHLFTDDAEYTNGHISVHSFCETCISQNSKVPELLCEFAEAYAYIIVGSGSTSRR